MGKDSGNIQWGLAKGGQLLIRCNPVGVAYDGYLPHEVEDILNSSRCVEVPPTETLSLKPRYVL